MTHGAEDALVHWCLLRGLAARPLRFVGYGEEDETGGETVESPPIAQNGGEAS